MTYKISMEVTANQIEGMINQLPLRDKIFLVRKLEKQTWAKRLQDVFDKTDTRRKKSKITPKEIWNEVKQARKEYYADRA